MFTSNIKNRGKCDISNFNPDMVVGVRWYGSSIEKKRIFYDSILGYSMIFTQTGSRVSTGVKKLKR